MTTIALPLLASTRSMQDLLGQAKIDLDQAGFEAATGRVYDLIDHMEGDTGAINRVEKAISDADRRIASVKLLQQEAANVQTVLTSIKDVALDLGARVTGAIGLDDDQSLTALQAEARAQLEAIWGRLNTSFNGVYQFSGAATDTPPLGDFTTFLSDIQAIVATAPGPTEVETALDTFFDDVAGDFQTTYYQGSTNAGPDRQVSESRRLGVDASALDEGVRDTLRGLALFVTADAIAGVEEAEELKLAAAERLNQAGMDIIEQQTIIGAAEEDAANLLAYNESEKATYELMLIDLVGVDQADAATRAQLLETQLQAIYLTTVRMANLSLANYL